MNKTMMIIAGLLVSGLVHADAYDGTLSEEFPGINSAEEMNVSAPEVGDATSDNHLDDILSDKEI